MSSNNNGPVLVMKFGGTSVGSAERIRNVAGIIAGEAGAQRVAVVVSAMSGVTNLLLRTLDHAEAGHETEVEQAFADLRAKHAEACAALLSGPSHDKAQTEVRRILGQFERIARGMLLLGERPPRSVDEAVPTGERITSLLLAALLTQMGSPARAVDGSKIIVTDDSFGNAAPDLGPTRQNAGEHLHPLLAEGETVIMTGFNGATPAGQPTTLGRGGSDFSASILAATLDAERLWIWTDVDGILSADPRVVPDARILPRITYDEAAELAYNGAKVLHPRTLAPLVEAKIPVWIKNTMNPAAPGTLIAEQDAATTGVRAITSLGGVSLITIEAVATNMSGAQLMGRALHAVARAGVEVLLLTRSSFRQNFCLLVRDEELADALQSLRTELELELAHDYVHPILVDDSVGLLAAVGEGMRGTPGLAGQVFHSISEASVNIIAIAQGSSELTIAIVVQEKDLKTAVRAVHDAYHLEASHVPA